MFLGFEMGGSARTLDDRTASAFIGLLRSPFESEIFMKTMCAIEIGNNVIDGTNLWGGNAMYEVPEGPRQEEGMSKASIGGMGKFQGRLDKSGFSSIGSTACSGAWIEIEGGPTVKQEDKTLGPSGNVFIIASNVHAGLDRDGLGHEGDENITVGKVSLQDLFGFLFF